MNKHTIRYVQLALLVAGLAGWIGLSKSLNDDGKLVHRPNVLHLKGSPFGRTLALAMRGPVDVYWHKGNVHEHSHEDGESCAECDQASGEEHIHGEECAHGEECEHPHGELCEHGEECEHPHGELCEHGEECEHPHGELCEHGEECEHPHGELCEHGEECEHGPECEHGEESASPVAAGPGERGLRPFLLNRIKNMRQSYYARTNQRSSTKLHRAYLMGETQRRLEISYHMDPTNLTGYGAYFLFLSEALARVEGEGDESGIVAGKRKAALHLADYTLRYCLNYSDEAPAMITAATAAHDCFQIHLDQADPNLKLAAEYLRLLDGSLQQYETLRQQMIENGTWTRFSIHRRAEMDQAHSLVRTMRAGDHQLIGELSRHTPASAGKPRS